MVVSLAVPCGTHTTSSDIYQNPKLKTFNAIRYEIRTEISVIKSLIVDLWNIGIKSCLRGIFIS